MLRLERVVLEGTTKFNSKVNNNNPDSKAIFFCFDLNDPNSLKALVNTIEIIKDFGENHLFYLVGCKSDLERKIPQLGNSQNGIRLWSHILQVLREEEHRNKGQFSEHNIENSLVTSGRSGE